MRPGGAYSKLCLARMLRLSIFDYVLWIFPQLCLAVVIWQIIRRRLFNSFWAFVAYCGLHLLRFAVLFSINLAGMRQHYAWYFYSYWGFEVLSVCLSLAVIREIYYQFFRWYPALQTFGAALFHWASAVLVLMSVASAAAAHGKEYDRVIAGVLVFDQVGTALRGGLLLLLLVIGLFFKLRWERRYLGIAIGFSIYLLVEFVVIAVRLHAGTGGNPMWRLLDGIAYSCCALVWAWTFVSKPRTESSPFPFSAAQLDDWNAALSKLLR